MDKKSKDFSMQEVMALAKTPAGKQLIDMLQHSDKAQLQQVYQQAAAGKYDHAAKTLRMLLTSPEAQALIKELEG